MRDERLVAPVFDWNHVLKEVYEFDRMRSVSKEEVHSSVAILDVDGMGLSLVLYDQLLQEEEGSLVGDLLPDLNRCDPLVCVGCSPGTQVTHVILNDILNNESVLKNRSVEYVLLYRQLHFQPLGVRFSPYERRVHQLDPLQSLCSFHAKRQEFLRLELCSNPVLRWLQVSPTTVAVEHRHLPLDTFRYVHLSLQAIHARVCRVRLDLDPAKATQHVTNSRLWPLCRRTSSRSRSLHISLLFLFFFFS
mmetsp:Transcript_216/g.414  ORF Transcript_216/g.414 Transcript_216/m.414 type:complete len:248 (-) Transcript_216:159-902(-)